MSEENPSIQAPEENNIAETGSITAKTSRGTVHCITIVGQIEGHMELPAQNKTCLLYTSPAARRREPARGAPVRRDQG